MFDARYALWGGAAMVLGMLGTQVPGLSLAQLPTNPFADPEVQEVLRANDSLPPGPAVDAPKRRVLVVRPEPGTDVLVERVDPETKVKVKTVELARYAIDPLGHHYNPATTMTLHGPITGQSRFPLGDGRTGLMVRLAVGGSFPYVYLGSESWLVRHEMTADITDRIEAVGSLVTIDGKTVLIAQSAVLDGRQLQIRDAQGRPFWPWREPIVVEREEAVIVEEDGAVD